MIPSLFYTPSMFEPTERYYELRRSRTLESERWENAYHDLKKERDRLVKEIEGLKVILDRAREWDYPNDIGC